jgi:SAM-dependent methyltransferase
MLQKVLQKRRRGPRIPLVQADATALPFADASFGATLAIHVLHLIPEWNKAARELMRVVRSGGAILIELGSKRAGIGEEIKRRFCEEANLAPRHRGLNDAGEVDALMASSGLRVRELEAVTESNNYTYEDAIARLESGIFSLTWGSSEEDRRRAGEATRAWARDRFGPLEQTYSAETTIAYRAYDVP